MFVFTNSELIATILVCLVRVFHIQRVRASVRAVTDDRQFSRIGEMAVPQVSLQEVYAIDRTVHEIVENGFVFHVGELERAEVSLHESVHVAGRRRIALTSWQSQGVMRIQLHVSDEAAFRASSHPDAGSQ